MLEFIVLGQVPGTNLYITFYQFTVLAMIVAIAVAGRHELREYLKNHYSHPTESRD